MVTTVNISPNSLGRPAHNWVLIMVARQGGKNSRLVPTVYLHMQTWGFQLKIICRLVRTLHGFPGFNQYPLSPSACSPTHFDAFQMHCSMTTLLQNERLTPLGMDQSVFPVSCRSCSWTILQQLEVWYEPRTRCSTRKTAPGKWLSCWKKHLMDMPFVLAWASKGTGPPPPCTLRSTSYAEKRGHSQRLNRYR